MKNAKHSNFIGDARQRRGRAVLFLVCLHIPLSFSLVATGAGERGASHLLSRIFRLPNVAREKRWSSIPSAAYLSVQAPPSPGRISRTSNPHARRISGRVKRPARAALAIRGHRTG